jgi:hypothetical protein
VVRTKPFHRLAKVKRNRGGGISAAPMIVYRLGTGQFFDVKNTFYYAQNFGRKIDLSPARRESVNLFGEN